MEIYFDVYFKNKDMEFSREFLSQYGSRIAGDLGINQVDILFALLKPKMGKITGHFLTKDKYLKLKINKKNGEVKKQSPVPYSRLVIEQNANPVGTGISYTFKFQEDGVDETFNIQYEYDEPSQIDRDGMAQFLAGLKQGISKSKNTNTSVPEIEAVLNGEVSLQSGNLITVQAGRMKKTLADLEKGGSGFLSLAQISGLDAIVFCDRTKFLGILEYYLFLKDRVVILKEVSKDLAESESRDEMLYSDINRIERGDRAAFNKTQDFSDFVFSLKKDMKEICTLSVDLSHLIKDTGGDRENYELLRQIFTPVLRQSVMSPDLCCDSAITTLAAWPHNIGSKDFILKLKEGLAPLVLLDFFETDLSQSKADEVFSAFDKTFLECLKKMKTLSKDVSVDKAKESIGHLEFMDDIRNYVRKIISRKFTGLSVPDPWDMTFLETLNKKIKRNRQSVVTSYALALTTGILVGAVWSAASDMKLSSALAKWADAELTAEIKLRENR